MTKQMTRVQLRVAIAEKRGWIQLQWGTSRLYGWHPGCATRMRHDVPDYLGSMDAALPLLREMPMAGLDYYESDLVTLTWSADDGDIHGVDSERGNEAEAVALAWWQWKTGEVVELVSE